MDSLTNFHAWRPIRLFWNGAHVMVDWARLGDAALPHPFYQDSVGELLRLPFHNAFRRVTRIDELLAWHERSPGIGPSLVIFHVSRCGSTLIPQTFSQSPRHLGLSEPAPVDFLLREALGNGYLDEEQVVCVLRAWLGAWAQRSESGSLSLAAVTLKLDSWCTDKAHVIERAWPDALRVFLTRDPLSVLVSQMNERALFLVPGVMGPHFGLPGVSLQEQCTMPADLFCARMLERVYADMTRVADPSNALILDYAELHNAVEERLLPRLSWMPDASEREAMRERLTRHGKHPHQPFASDTATKHASASPALHALAKQWLEPHYRALLQKRSAYFAEMDNKIEALT